MLRYNQTKVWSVPYDRQRSLPLSHCSVPIITNLHPSYSTSHGNTSARKKSDLKMNPFFVPTVMNLRLLSTKRALIAQSCGNLAIQMSGSDCSITWKPGHTNVCVLSDRSMIRKPGHTSNVCILSDRSMMWKPGHTNAYILSDRLIIWKPGHKNVKGLWE